MEASYANSFPEGNYESYVHTFSVYVPRALNLLRRTIVPAVEGLLLQLIGSTRDFDRKNGSIMPATDRDDGVLSMLVIKLVYEAASLRVEAASKKAIEEDTRFLVSRLRKIPQMASLKEDAVTINTENGTITFSFTLKMNAGVPQG